MTDDAALLRRYCDEGSDEAFAELVRRHIDMVYSVALRKLADNPHLAEDAVQTVFTDLARKAGSLSAHPALSAWLFKSTHFAATNLSRAERRRRQREKQGLAMQELLHRPEPLINWERVRPVLDDAINELSDRDREAVILRFFHGLEFAAVGARLNLSAEGARSRVERAVDKLHVALARRGVTSTAAGVAAALGQTALITAPAGLATTISTGAVASAGIAAAGAIGASGAAAAVFAALKLPLAITAAVALAGTAIYHARSSQDERNVKRAEPQSAGGENVSAPIASTPVASATQSKPPERSAASDSEKDPAIVAGDEFLEKHPDVKELLARSQRARLAGRYFPLYVELGLDDAKATAFEEIVSSTGAASSYTNISHTNILGPGTFKLRPFPKLPEAERERRLHDLLGPGGYQRYKHYSTGGAGYAMRVAAGLYYTDWPLTKTQAEQLTRLFADIQSRLLGGGRRDPAIYWQQIFSAARTVLNPAQLRPLEAMRAEDQQNWAQRVAAQPAANTQSSPPAVSLEMHLDQLANNPQIQLFVLAKKRAQFADVYGPFFHARGLSVQEIEKLGDAFVHRVEQHEDLDAITRTRMIPRSTEISAQRDDAEIKFGAAVTALLGADGYAAFRDYERSRSIRGYVGKMAGIAAVSGIPFTAQQADQLTAIIANTSAAYAKGGVANFREIDWSVVEAAAANILSGDQLRLLHRADVADARSRWYPQVSKALRPNVQTVELRPWQL